MRMCHYPQKGKAKRKISPPPEPPPKPPDDSSDSSSEEEEEEGNGEKGAKKGDEEFDKLVFTMTEMFHKMMNKVQEKTDSRKVCTVTVNPTAPSYASLFPIEKPHVSDVDVGRENRRFTFPAHMFDDDDDLPAPLGGFIDPPQLFPITRQPGPPGMLNINYMPMEYKFFKDLKSAVAQYGPQSPFVLTMMETVGTAVTFTYGLGGHCASCT